MASACVNNAPLPLFSSPRLSFTRDTGSDPDLPTVIGPDPEDFIDFEFHLNDPVSIIPADELFYNGKLVPLHLAPVKMPGANPDPLTKPQQPPETPRQKPLIIGSASDLFAVSPKAPTCSSRWRELLRRKRQQQQHHQQTPKQSDPNPNPKSIKFFLNRNNRSGSESLPLLKDSEPDPPTAAASISTRHSVSGPEPDIDPENKPNQNPILLNRNPPKNRVRSAPARKPAEPVAAAADSPRMNASGKVVFQGLGRSASSPSTCGARAKSYRGMERSYSANVRVTPVLNVPVCSLRGGSKGFGFGQLFSGSSSGSVPKGGNGNLKGKN